MSKAIAFFDFDGTITTSDSLAEFIRFKQGSYGFITGLLPLLPSILGFKAGFVDRQYAKEKLLAKFFAGIPEEKFRALATNFVQEKIPSIVRPKAMEKLRWHQHEGHEVVIVSASPAHWVEPWCTSNGFICISTELETVNGKITGKILGKNCHGEEKVRRIKERFRLSDYSSIYAYGDTSGDEPMLALASFSYYKPFL
ncbi:MAG TPA: HAD family hydrolase [Chitinophagaceae bacterium]|nr:HAD family hydrolase [Chitinophagaceae bacterium]